ncbi:MAG: AAA family ATPase [Christensenellales bacterium]
MNDMIICIGRQYGSGGREIGEKLAARLGVTCYDKLLLKQAAKEGGVSLGEVERQDEKPVSASAFLSGNVFADSASIGGAFYSQSQLVYDAEKEAILDAADKGGCVIIGRCASSLLRDRKNVLSVFIYADEADRVARIARRNRLDEPQARARMRKTDRMRRRYFDFYADTQWGDPESYDVMLSSSYYGVDGCVEMICKSLQMKGNSHE